MLGERFEKERQRDGLDRLRPHDRVGLDLGIVTSVRVVISFFGQPRVDVGRLGLWIIESPELKTRAASIRP